MQYNTNMPKSAQELEEIVKKMRDIGEQLGSDLADQRRATDEALEAQQRERKRNIDSDLAKFRGDNEARRRHYVEVTVPARDLYAMFTIWNRLPEGMNKKTTSQITDLIGRAQKDDLTAQQILTETKKFVTGDKTIKTAGLPNLEWQPKVEPPTKP